MDMLTREEIRAYLNRIGIPKIEAPTKPYLFELHKAQVRNLSWQTVDIFGRKPAGIDSRVRSAHRKPQKRLLLSSEWGVQPAAPFFRLQGIFASGRRPAFRSRTAREFISPWVNCLFAERTIWGRKLDYRCGAWGYAL